MTNVLVSKETLVAVLSYIFENEAQSFEEYIESGGSAEDHIYGLASELMACVDSQ